MDNCFGYLLFNDACRPNVHDEVENKKRHDNEQKDAHELNKN